MEPDRQKTIEVINRLYSHLINIKENRTITFYSDCFEHGFNLSYDKKKYCHFILEREVTNNIPFILGAIGRECNVINIPPLCCLVVNKSTKKCGIGVITSKELPDNDKPEFAEKIDRPNVYNYNNYPKLGTIEADKFIDNIMERLRKKGLTVEFR